MPKILYHLLIMVLFVLFYFLTPAQALAAVCDTGCSCSSVSGCPTGDASIGVNFTGLTTADLQNGTFRVTATGESSQYTCNYSGGTAGSIRSCDAAFNSAANNIECGIEHLDCRNKPFNITLSYPNDYDCTPSIDSVNAQNCQNNTPITVNCTPPIRSVYTCSGTRSTGESLSCQSGSSCPANYIRDTSKTCAPGSVCCFYNPAPPSSVSSAW